MEEYIDNLRTSCINLNQSNHVLENDINNLLNNIMDNFPLTGWIPNHHSTLVTWNFNTMGNFQQCRINYLESQQNYTRLNNELKERADFLKRDEKLLTLENPNCSVCFDNHRCFFTLSTIKRAKSNLFKCPNCKKINKITHDARIKKFSSLACGDIIIYYSSNYKNWLNDTI
jgi:phage FluMu protein Com